MRRSYGVRGRACSRKFRYYTKAAAKNASRRVRAETGVPVRPYKCGHCGSFHIGTVNDGGRR